MIWKKLVRCTQSVLQTARGAAEVGECGRSSLLDLAELEDRILMSATPMAPDAMADADVDEALEVQIQLEPSSRDDLPADDGQQEDGVAEPEPADPAAMLGTLEHNAKSAARHQLVVVDTSFDGYEELLDYILDSQDESTQLSLLELDGNSDGVEQISRVLHQYDQLDTADR